MIKCLRKGRCQTTQLRPRAAEAANFRLYQRLSASHYLGISMEPPRTATFLPCLKRHHTLGSGLSTSSSPSAAGGGSSSLGCSFCIYSPVSWFPFLKTHTPLPKGLLYLNLPE